MFFFFMQQFMMVKYVHIVLSKNTKIKSSVYMNDIYTAKICIV